MGGLAQHLEAGRLLEPAATAETLADTPPGIFERHFGATIPAETLDLWAHQLSRQETAENTAEKAETFISSSEEDDDDDDDDDTIPAGQKNSSDEK